jgi:hypothetical protein
MRPLTAVLAAAAVCSAGGIVEESLDFLNRLASQGYEGVYMTPLEIDLLEPCTLKVLMNPSVGDGFFMALGGDRTLDLMLTVRGDGWEVSDSMPDDFPILELHEPVVATVREMVVLALDMTHNAMRDSVVVMYAVEVVDRVGVADDVPSDQDQDSTGVQ